MPATLSKQVLKLEKITIDLGALEAQWRAKLGSEAGSMESEWLDDTRIRWKSLKNGEWRVRFGPGCQAAVSPEYDPADGLRVGPSVLVIKFNEAALSKLDAAIRENSSDARACACPWRLEEMRITVAPMLPLANVVSVFLPEEHAVPECFEDYCWLLSSGIAQLWPLFYALLDRIEDPPRIRKDHVWEDRHLPFGLPASLFAASHPDLDPSEEYLFGAHLFLKGTQSQVAAFLNAQRFALEPLEEEQSSRRAKHRARDGIDIRLCRGTTVWILPENHSDCSADLLRNYVCSVALAPDLQKLVAF